MLGIKYVIKKGDTLAKIAKEYFGDTRKWEMIFSHNNKPEVKSKLKRPIANPNMITAGEFLFLPGTSVDFQRGTTIVVRDTDGTMRIQKAKTAEQKRRLHNSDSACRSWRTRVDREKVCDNESGRNGNRVLAVGNSGRKKDYRDSICE